MTPSDTSVAAVLRDVTVRRGPFVLGPVSVHIPRGITALLGANGAGKTTFIRTLVQLDRPGNGTISWAPTASQAAAPRTLRVGYLPQDFTPPARVRADDFLHYVAWCNGRGGGSSLVEAEVARALELVGLADRSRTRCGQLSGGMQRRLGVASALLADPTAVVLDEPTVGLDPAQRQHMRSLLHDLAAERAVVLSTHLCEDVASLASHVLVLDQGRICFEGSPNTLVGPGRTVSSTSIEQAFTHLLEREERA